MSEVVTGISALLTLAINALEAAQKTSQLIEQAHREGRDLTPEEVAQSNQERADAMARLHKLLGE